MQYKLILPLLVFLLLPLGSHAQRTGSITGVVVDAETQQTLPGANVFLPALSIGTATDNEGRFLLEDIPVGSHPVQLSFIGYTPLILADVIVRSSRATEITASLSPALVEGEGVTVEAAYFSDETYQPVSAIGFSAEEIRRAPGSAGDVSRIMLGLPSVAKTNDTSNSLAVRGGSPMENAFFVDNIQIPNINHFPAQGSSGGPIGLLNVDFIADVDFLAGGFSAEYGDRLSAVVDLTLREGSRTGTEFQADLSLAGAGVIAEGPIGDKGSWLASVRRSYLDLLVSAFFEDVSTVPIYSDYQGKLVYDVNRAHRISALGILGVDQSGFEREGAIEDSENVYGPADFVSGTAGVNWRWLHGPRGYSNTSLSYSRTDFDVNYFDTLTDDELFYNNSVEQFLRLRNVNYLRFSDAHRTTFGADAELVRGDFVQRFDGEVDIVGNPVDAVSIDRSIRAEKVGGFVVHEWAATPALTIKPSLRVDHFTLTANSSLSPRVSVALQVTPKTKASVGAGVFRQSLPLALLAQNRSYADLPDLTAVHFIAGVQHLLASDTKFSAEVYHKAYSDFPSDPQMPSLFLVDEVSTGDGLIASHERLVSTGAAQTTGVELLIQKKLSNRFYGLASGTFFRSRYRDAGEQWRPRVFDNQLLLSGEGGLKLSERRQVSARWIVAGGAPFTPFDEVESTDEGSGILDTDAVHSDRLPTYHSLNIRYDRRFFFKRASLTTYLSIWNTYGRRNISGYVWDNAAASPKSLEQWGLLPIFGVELEL